MSSNDVALLVSLISTVKSDLSVAGGVILHSQMSMLRSVTVELVQLSFLMKDIAFLPS